MVDFIGIGAQRTGTSWTYACLYEHPEICAPVKEIHFFSRPRFEKGREWYEAHFARCAEKTKRGEFSTSYLYSDDAAARIQTYYPDVKLVVILRDPITRAYSQYGNAVKGGEVSETMTFTEYCAHEKSALEQGLYAAQLQRYFDRFDRSQVLVLFHEDIDVDKRAFIRRIYEFLGVRADFVPSMLERRINTSRVPKVIGLERGMHYVSEFLRRSGLDRLVHFVRRTGLPDLIRTVNTKAELSEEGVDLDRCELTTYFKRDVETLSAMLGRDLVSFWRLGGPRT